VGEEVTGNVVGFWGRGPKYDCQMLFVFIIQGCYVWWRWEVDRPSLHTEHVKVDTISNTDCRSEVDTVITTANLALQQTFVIQLAQQIVLLLL